MYSIIIYMQNARAYSGKGEKVCEITLSQIPPFKNRQRLQAQKWESVKLVYAWPQSFTQQNNEMV